MIDPPTRQRSGGGLFLGIVQRLPSRGNVIRIKPAKPAALAGYDSGSEILLRILDVTGEDGAAPSDIVGRTQIAHARVIERSGEKVLELDPPEPKEGVDPTTMRERMVSGVRFDILGGF